jgi:hypothetical protein
VIGPIVLESSNNTVNFQGGNWLQTIDTSSGSLGINTRGAPFVVAGSIISGFQVAVLDPTTFALADRSLTNFTGEISENAAGPLRRHECGRGRWGAGLCRRAEFSCRRPGAGGIFRHSLGSDVVCLRRASRARQGGGSGPVVTTPPSGEATAMSDKSNSFAATGSARVSF